MPDAPEAVVLMRVLRDMNFPKFVFEDVPLFLGLIKDLFPGVECPRIAYPELVEVVEKVLQDDGYILIPEQVTFFLHNFYLKHKNLLLKGRQSGSAI